jgi:hypothetical protein
LTEIRAEAPLVEVGVSEAEPEVGEKEMLMVEIVVDWAEIWSS